MAARPANEVARWQAKEKREGDGAMVREEQRARFWGHVMKLPSRQRQVGGGRAATEAAKRSHQSKKEMQQQRRNRAKSRANITVNTH